LGKGAGAPGGGPLRLAVALFLGLTATSFGKWVWAAQELNPQLAALPSNQWVKVSDPGPLHWVREAHAGLVYDSNRGTLLTFGSDTHGHGVSRDLDNEIHEFSPFTGTWLTLYERAPRRSYRADGKGYPISGFGDPMPWAMHTYDALVFDPRWNALWVAATLGPPFHNPVLDEAVGVTRDSLWVYDLRKWKWVMFQNRGKSPPPLFGGAAVYDSRRDTLVAYDSSGVWELGPARDEWKHATAESHHVTHFNMEYSPRSGKLFVFGGQTDGPDGALTNDVWVYSPGPTAGAEGKWERRRPAGDPCPEAQHYPVAYQPEADLFLLVPDHPKAGQSLTMVYEPSVDRYTRIVGAEMEPLGMNYMMVYDTRHRVFLLVKGDWRKPPVVWAFRLDVWWRAKDDP